VPEAGGPPVGGDGLAGDHLEPAVGAGTLPGGVDVAAGALDGLTMASRLEALRLVTGPGREFTDDERIKSAIDKERAARRSSSRRKSSPEKSWKSCWRQAGPFLIQAKGQAAEAGPLSGWGGKPAPVP
jgi:hypothetical protein